MTRGSVCLKASAEPDAGTLPWVKRLHSSHDPEPGAYSVCMHRDDAVTVSMTLVEVSGDTATMRYHDGSPCQSHSSEPRLARQIMLA